MGVAVRARAAGGRSRVSFGESASPSIDPWSDEFADRDAGRAGTCPEIDCVRALLARDVIEAAEDRAAVLGVGADRVLIAAGALSEEAYLRALGDALGVAFEPLDDMPRTLCPLNDDRLIESAAAGMLPLAIDDELYLVVAPRGGATRRILHLIEENPARAQRFRYTSAERLNRFVLRCAGTAIAARAANSLKQKWPMLSAAPPRWRTNFVSVAIVMLLALAATVVAPAGTMLAFEMALAAVFLAWLGLRLTGAFVEWLVADPLPGPPDDALPVYTVIAALYREAASVDGLLTAIERLDRLPLPLGGSSNHFHTASLRAVGGWDPYNVTEDADLGMRFARFGYRSSVLNSTTYEEAPARFGPWAAPAHALVQRLDADLGRAYAPAGPTATRFGPAGLSHLPAHRRRQCAGGAGASAVLGRADLFGGERRPDVARRERHRLHPGRGLRHDGRDRLSDVGLSRLARPVAPRPVGHRLGAGADAGALAAALAGGLARALSARVRALRLGEDRARSGEKLAASG